jgi:hypothetical protein
MIWAISVPAAPGALGEVAQGLLSTLCCIAENMFLSHPRQIFFSLKIWIYLPQAQPVAILSTSFIQIAQIA